MKLLCPKCLNEIPKASVNLDEGFATCPECDEYFRVADHIRLAGRLSRVDKPLVTSIIEEKTDDEVQYSVKHPANQFLLLTTVLVMATAGITIIRSGFVLTTLVYIIPLALLFVGLLLQNRYGRKTLRITRDELMLEQQLFGYRMGKTRKLADLKAIFEGVEVDSRQNQKHHIVLAFETAQPLRLGYRLTHDERVWLMGEMYAVTNGFVGWDKD